MAKDGFTTVRITNASLARVKHLATHLRQVGLLALDSDLQTLVVRRGVSACSVVEIALVALERHLGAPPRRGKRRA